MNYRYVVIMCFLALIVISSCESPTAAIVQGSISGRVLLRSLTGKMDQENHSVSVSLNGNKSYSGLSADSGKFVLTGVEQGIYSLTYSKTGYKPYTTNNIQFVGNGTLSLETVVINAIDTLVSPIDSTHPDRRCYGYIRLYDENGDSLSDHSGVQISINGTNTSAVSEKSGIFYFNKYPSGKFDITISKSGFDDLILPQIVFPDSNKVFVKSPLRFQNASIIELAKRPNLEAVINSIMCSQYFSIETHQDGSHDTSIYMSYSLKVSPTGYGKQVIVFAIVSDSESVSINNYYVIGSPYLQLLDNPKRTNSRGQTFNTVKGSSSTRWHIDHTGRKLYSRVYALWARGVGNSLQYFTDPITKRTIFSGFTASPVMSVTLPTEFKIE